MPSSIFVNDDDDDVMMMEESRQASVELMGTADHRQAHREGGVAGASAPGPGSSN